MRLHFCKQGIGSTTAGRTFPPKDDLTKILSGKTFGEEKETLNTFYGGKILIRKKRKVDEELDDVEVLVSSNSMDKMDIVKRSLLVSKTG